MRIQSFGWKLTGSWNPPKTYDTAADYQAVVLFSHATAALNTSTSYWLLRENGLNHDAHIIARHLFERMVQSRRAYQSPEEAIKAVVSEIAERRRLMEIYIGNLSSSEAHERLELEAMLAEEEKEQHQLCALAGIPVGDYRSNFLGVTQALKIEPLYRSVYFHLSAYAHATFGTARPVEYEKEASRSADHLALAGPMECALNFYHRSTDTPDASVLHEYKSLADEAWSLT